MEFIIIGFVILIYFAYEINGQLVLLNKLIAEINSIDLNDFSKKDTHRTH